MVDMLNDKSGISMTGDDGFGLNALVLQNGRAFNLAANLYCKHERLPEFLEEPCLPCDADRDFSDEEIDEFRKF